MLIARLVLSVRFIALGILMPRAHWNVQTGSEDGFSKSMDANRDLTNTTFKGIGPSSFGAILAVLATALLTDVHSESKRYLGYR